MIAVNRLLAGSVFHSPYTLLGLPVYQSGHVASSSRRRSLTLPDQPLPGAAQTVQRTVLCMGRKQEAVENVPVGNTVRLRVFSFDNMIVLLCLSCTSIVNLCL